MLCATCHRRSDPTIRIAKSNSWSDPLGRNGAPHLARDRGVNEMIAGKMLLDAHQPFATTTLCEPSS
jgi:hypothetical protein